MKKLIIILTTIFLSISCNAKDIPLNQLFTEDSVFGIKRSTTYDELSKTIDLELVRKGKNITIYRSKAAPLPNSLFDNYIFFIDDQGVIRIISAIRQIKNITNGDGSKIKGEYNKLIEILDSKFDKYAIESSCSSSEKFKNGKPLPNNGDQTDYDEIISVCKKEYLIDKSKLSISVSIGVKLKDRFEYLAFVASFR